MYPRSVCPHPYGSFVVNGCDIFLVFQTAGLAEKIRRPRSGIYSEVPYVIRRPRRPDRTSVSGFTAYGCRVPLAGKHTAQSASVEFCTFGAKLCAQSGCNLYFRKQSFLK